MKSDTASTGQPVAIIGMGGMFANSRNIKDYWRSLVNGTDCITDPPASHCRLNDYFDADPKRPDHIYCNRGGFLPAYPFDPTEFGIPPASLEATDTSQLLGLVGAKMALADAGYGDGQAFDREHTSVILGVTGTQELVISLGSRLGHPHWRKALESSGLSDEQQKAVVDAIADSYVPWQENSFPGLLGNVVAGRICNRLNLGGTNCVVDAACASSLSAIHLSLMELQAGRSNMVVTGGVDTINDIFMHMCFAKTGVLSHSGDARPFSADADGTVLGEGIGIIVLKRLADAERDGDRIYAVIRGIGASSDGKSQSIYAPRADGQVRALNGAYHNAGIDPGSIGMIEAHGTGTRVGDEVEFSALRTVFSVDGGANRRCALGSVKSMIGHTKAAAGAAGMIKAALALYNKVLPPTLKADRPDPRLNIDDSPFYLNTTARPWVAQPNTPRRSGVSSFGFGGSNFHVVLEEYGHQKQEIAWDGSVELLAFSGSDTPSVVDGLDRFKDGLKDAAEPAVLSGMARGQRAGFRTDHRLRLILVLETAQPIESLEKKCQRAADVVRAGRTAWLPAEGIYFFSGNSQDAKVAFMFPGQGSQYVYMGRDLACRFPQFMQAVEAADTVFGSTASLAQGIYPVPATSEAQRTDQETALRRTDRAQPAIGAVSLGMLAVLEHFNIRPSAVCGHSYGELPALHAAGRLDRNTLLRLSEARGRLMAQAGKDGETGAMLAVMAPIRELKAMAETLTDTVLANINSPEQGVLSGTSAAIEVAAGMCRDRGYRCVALPVAAAFHSPLVKSASEPFAVEVRNATMATGNVPVYANVNAAPYPDDPAACADLLSRQMTSTVDFQGIIDNLYRDGVTIFVEVGPKRVLSGLVEKTLGGKDIYTIAMDRSAGKQSGMLDLAHAIGQLAALGVDVDLDRWEAELPASRTPKMVVPLTGANYRTPRQSGPTDRSETSRAPVSSHTNLDSTDTSNRRPMLSPKPMKPTPSQTTTTAPTAPQQNQTAAPDSPPHPSAAAGMNDALAIVQKGLASIQALQQQTAQAHQTFLETQAQASRTLQEMIQSARVVFAPLNGLSSTGDTGQPKPPPVAAVSPEVPRPSMVPPKAATTPSVRSGPAPETIAVPAEPTASDTGASSNDTTADASAVSDALLSVVAELTGYPVEMLDLEMDIEADLGIDSIKRVEILSAMEERMPHLPQVTPDRVGSLKTLGQICDFLGQERSRETDAVAPESAANSATTEEPGPSTVRTTLLSVVAELTGYPVEMLDLEMDIEADLGIDSIKRVEILSAMEERMPHLPQVTPDRVGSLKTLGQICDFLGQERSRETDGAAARPAVSRPSTEAAGPSTVRTTLLSVVAELTGYPVEMLDLEMDIEADLGIDSIKRVEILSAMEERMPHLPQVTPDRVGSLKTLGQICDFLGQERSRETDGAAAPEDPPTSDPALSEDPVPTATIPRRIVTPVEAPAMPSRTMVPSNGGWIGVVDDRSELARAIAGTLSERDIPNRLLPLGNGIEAEDFNAIAGLIVTSGTDAESAFLAAKHAAPFLKDASQTGGALFAVVTRLDGAFGFSGQRFDRPEQGALAGLAKTAALEWPSVTCRAIDLAPDWPHPDEAAQAVVAELMTVSDNDPVEVGLGSGTRVHLKSIAAEAVDAPDESIPSGVFVITGGARGVTAACARALAQRSGVSIALVGRSAVPFDVPAWLVGVHGEADIKRTIAANAFPDAAPTPKALEAEYRRQTANLEILKTMEALRDAGVQAGYFSADVTDADSLNAALDAVRSELGPIVGLVHGAGVLHDRLIVDKSLDQFRRVYATKVDGFNNLLAATNNDPIGHMILFSSVAARTGNIGQCDYAMANEALNKLARMESLNRPGCHVKAINWGPWDGGMVTASLKKVFEDREVPLIPLDAGAAMMVTEIGPANADPVEVLVGSMLSLDQDGDGWNMLERRELDLKRYPVLASHVIGGKPVVPFALISEWIGHGAMKENPGYALHGIDDFRLLSGIRLEDERKLVRLMAGKARKNGNTREVDIELRNGVKNGKDVIHSRARALLVDRLPEAPVFRGNGKNGQRPFPRELDAVYGEILFHGEQLRAIKAIDTYSDHGMTARLTNAPEPAAWMLDPITDRWTADPMVLDGAFQMAILWCFEQTGKVCLPSYARSYRQYRTVFPPTGVTAVMSVVSAANRKLIADFTFLDDARNVVATLNGYEATMDETLIHAFNENKLDAVITDKRQ